MSETIGGGPGRVRMRVAWALVLLVTAAAFAPTLGFDFLLDDYQIGRFAHAEGGVDWAEAFRYFFPSHLEHDQFLRPIPVLSGAVDLAVWGPHPFGFHLTNLLIHLLGTLLVGLLATRLSSNRWVGPFAALAYGLYPGNAESVAWVIHRMVGLTVVFYALTLLLHTRAKLRPLAWLAALLAILCKEPAANLPAAVFLLHFYRLSGDKLDVRERVRQSIRAVIPYVVVVVIFLIWKRLAFGSVNTGYGPYATYTDYFFGEQIYRDLPMSLLRFLSPVNGEIVPSLAVWLHVMFTVVGIGLLAVHRTRESGTRVTVLYGAALALLSLLVVFAFLRVPAGLTNSRHFSVPAIGLALVIGGLLAGQERRGRVIGVVWLLLWAAPLAVNLKTYHDAGGLARAVRVEVAALASDYPPDVKIVVARTPSAWFGAPVFGDGSALRAALSPPFTHRRFDVVAVLDDPPGDPDSTLLTLDGPVAAFSVCKDLAWKHGKPEVFEIAPPAPRWSYPAPGGVQLLAPAPAAEVSLADDPVFVFRCPGEHRFYRIVFEAGRFVLPVTVSRFGHLDSGEDGALTYRLSRGDVHGAHFLHRAEVRGARGAITWYVEGVDDYTRLRSAKVRSKRATFRATGEATPDDG